MTRNSLFISIILLVGPVVGAACLQADEASTPVQLPLKKNGTKLSITVPEGLTQLTLEGRSGSGWKPVAVQYVEVEKSNKGSAGGKKLPASLPTRVVNFNLPKGYAVSDLRAMGSAPKFPADLLKGQKEFSHLSTGADTGALMVASGNVAMASQAAGDAGRLSVTESDIWKVVGDQLFFFNQYRGLQVFDVANPLGPIRTGTLRLAASGEQFYTLDASGAYLALLGVDQTAEPGSLDNQAVFVLSVTDGAPKLAIKLPIQGAVADSRLIGSRLYVVSTHSSDQGNGWSPQVNLHGFDLSDPENPLTFAPVTLTGHSPVLQATDETLLVATTSHSDWYNSMIHVLDISQPDGQPALTKTLPAAGRISDKFKLQVADGVVSSVSAVWNWAAADGVRQTWVETFSATGTETEPLGQLELEAARGETLHATRFDGQRLYVVTFLNIDPLFVVDLSDPTALEVKGHLDVPGWSTYIEPYGDGRLVAVGVESGQVTVSLFDVADPAAPTLLSRVKLGNSWSWSEANYDEKAVGFFPDRGVLLVPYQTLSDSGWQTATGVLKVTPDAITFQSSIEHQFTARRAALAGDNIISISGQEMIVEDATDLTSLQLLAQLSLSWKVDRVLPFGGKHLIQIADGSSGQPWYGGLRFAGYSSTSADAMLRISRADDPDALIEEVEMGRGQVIGTAQKGDRFYVGQFVPAENDAPDVLRTWVFDASAPPALPEIAYVDTVLPAVSGRLNFSNSQALWPDASTLVWHIPASPWWSYWGGPVLMSSDISVMTPLIAAVSTSTSTTVKSSPAAKSSAKKPAASTTSSGVTINGGFSFVTPEKPGVANVENTAAVLCPLSLTNPDAPVELPAIAVSGSGVSVRSGSGKAFASGGFVFVAYEEDVLEAVSNAPVAERSAAVIQPISIFGHPMYHTRSWLKVVDLRDSTAVVVRDRTSIPGQLLGVSDVDDRGAVLLTNTASVNWGPIKVQACGYDGVNAYQLDEWQSDGEYWGATTSDAGRLFLARGGTAPGVTALGFDAATGSIKLLGTLSTAQTASELVVVNSYLLASSWGKLDAAFIGSDGSLKSHATFDAPTNLWIQVSRAGVDPDAGIWLPVGDYGVEFLGFTDLAAIAAAP